MRIAASHQRVALSPASDLQRTMLVSGVTSPDTLGGPVGRRLQLFVSLPQTRQTEQLIALDGGRRWRRVTIGVKTTGGSTRLTAIVRRRVAIDMRGVALRRRDGGRCSTGCATRATRALSRVHRQRPWQGRPQERPLLSRAGAARSPASNRSSQRSFHGRTFPTRHKVPKMAFRQGPESVQSRPHPPGGQLVAPNSVASRATARPGCSRLARAS